MFLPAILTLFTSQSARPADVPRDELKAAVERSLFLLEYSAVRYTEHRECFSCHHQAVPAVALTEARRRGFAVKSESLETIRQFTLDSLDRGKKNYLKGQGQGGRADTAGYALFALDTCAQKACDTTAAVVEYLLSENKNNDHWRNVSNRPPSEASRFTTTYVALRGLKAFGTDQQGDRIAERIDKVRPWVVNGKPKDTEDHVFRLRALALVGADRKVIQDAADALLQLQRGDGGWAQTKGLASDAYATGSALAALHQAAGLPVTDLAYQRGLRFLLASQLPDGSWHVRSRSKPFQRYFESGFPHEKDQFISIAASGWATNALLLAYPAEKSVQAGRR
jgi:hypothetical protein